VCACCTRVSCQRNVLPCGVHRDHCRAKKEETRQSCPGSEEATSACETPSLASKFGFELGGYGIEFEVRGGGVRFEVSSVRRRVSSPARWQDSNVRVSDSGFRVKVCKPENQRTSLEFVANSASEALQRLSMILSLSNLHLASHGAREAACTRLF
jgi:hypothetical protein